MKVSLVLEIKEYGVDLSHEINKKITYNKMNTLRKERKISW